MHISQGQFIASTADVPSFKPLHDLVVGTFRLLRHTPVGKLGINYGAHYQMDSEEQLHELGGRLAPQDDWTDLLTSPKMKTLIMESERTDSENGYIRVKSGTLCPDA